MKTLIALLITFATVAIADDIHLKNGDVYHNVHILKTESGTVHLRSTTSEFTVSVDRIKKIEQKQFDPNTPSQTIMGAAPQHRAKNAQYTYSNAKLWPITALAAVVAIDAFAEAGQLGNQLDAFKDLGSPDNVLDSIQSSQTRKQIVGGVAVAVAIVNTIVVFQKVKLTAQNGMVGLAVNF